MNETGACPHCMEDVLIEDEVSGELVCPNCGYVITCKILDRRPEWRIYGSIDNDNNRERVGAPLTYLIHDMGLSTLVAEDGENIEGISKILKKSIVESGDKKLIKVLSMIHSLSLKIRLPDNVEENAALIVRRAWKRGMKIGRSCKGVAAASLYISCKIFSIPKTMKDFMTAFDLDRRTFWNSYRRLMEIVDIKKDDVKIEIVISKIINQLNLRGDVEELASKIIEIAREYQLIDGRKPESLAAASIYLAAKKLGYRVSQRRLARVASITEVTLRSRCRELLKLMDSRP
ncbi:MAG: transcription initiation factor IIB family protein [Nitrososphaeria archaeon]|nr:transcription initiation factor IIB family protein [Nitrososphaeria archaeon]